ncbi:MAG: restriction endonuclease [Betaproteobacteria bacterium]|nr:restriction endonuclease [Betaproteobacteria bacterium]
MARRKQSPFEDLIEITAKLPWWAGVALAVVSYGVLHYFATKEIVVTADLNGGGGADGGVDLVIAQGADRYVVQCKQRKARQVGVSVVRELYGVMTAQGAAGGFVVTSGAFTEEARRFAEGREIELVACDPLLAMIREQHSHPAPSKAANLDAGTAPSCPQCKSPMVLRTARKGAQVGTSFWGCSKYPGCRGTRPV